MSKALIAQYYNRLDKLIQFGGTKKETSVRNEFYNLMGHYTEKFNTYRFADYKEKVIDLLKRVCTVSVETVRVVGEMEDIK
jgi:hypothetical protein